MSIALLSSTEWCLGCAKGQGWLFCNYCVQYFTLREKRRLKALERFVPGPSELFLGWELPWEFVQFAWWTQTKLTYKEACKDRRLVSWLLTYAATWFCTLFLPALYLSTAERRYHHPTLVLLECCAHIRRISQLDPGFALKEMYHFLKLWWLFPTFNCKVYNIKVAS